MRMTPVKREARFPLKPEKEGEIALIAAITANHMKKGFSFSGTFIDIAIILDGMDQLEKVGERVDYVVRRMDPEIVGSQSVGDAHSFDGGVSSCEHIVDGVADDDCVAGSRARLFQDAQNPPRVGLFHLR